MKFIVFIIDDSIMSEFATRMVLEQFGVPCKIFAFESAEEALEALKKTSRTGEGVPDFILLDLKMPEMDGWGFLDKLSAIGIHNGKTEIYLVSNYVGAKVRKKADEHNMIKGYLERPLSQSDIKKIFSKNYN